MSFDEDQWATARHAQLGEGAEKVARKTQRRVNLPTDLGVRLPLDYAHGKMTEFRASTLVEVLREQPDGEEYEVTVIGPVVTTKGADHATNVGQCVWTGTPLQPNWRNRKAPAQVPDDVAAYLWGADRMRSWTSPAQD
jgi:hypothetical protein